MKARILLVLLTMYTWQAPWHTIGAKKKDLLYE